MGAAIELVIHEPWMDGALCVETDPDAFFPERGSSPRQAKRICNGTTTAGPCPVKDACLEFALVHDERFGVWGGLTEAERRPLRAETPPARNDPAAPSHGTEARAQWDRRRNIQPCQLCLDAETFARKVRADRQAVVQIEGKTCRECGELKPAAEFAIENGRRDGLSRNCKPCKSRLYQQWYQATGRGAGGKVSKVAV